jgi:hypothetical protein
MRIAMTSGKGRMRMGAMALPLLLGCLTSCMSFRPEEGQGKWRRIRWSKDYAEARHRAQEENKPILVILVSGDLEADC